MLEKLAELRKRHLKTYHNVTFYPYQERISNAIIEALLKNLRLTHNATEEDIKKLKLNEIPVEISRQCIAEGSFVTLGNGDVKRIEDIVVSDAVTTYDGYQQTTAAVEDAWSTGKKECYEVRTLKGKRLVVTGQHRFLTQAGFKSIDTGLGVNSKLRPSSHKNSELATVGISNAGSFGDVNDAELAKLLGCVPEAQRDMPSSVFAFDEPTTALFLNRLYAADGWISSNEIGMSAHSLRYAHQIQSLLAKFGISSSMSLSRGKKSKADFYKVRVYDARSVGIFFTQIGLIYGKEHQCRVLQDKHRGNTYSIGRTEQDVLWDYITSITPVGNRRTYDLTVSTYHNYVANGFVVHNSGKTTAIVLTVEFIMIYLSRMFNQRIHIGIFAPQQEQAKTDFDRLKEALLRSKTMMVVRNEEEKEYQEQSNAKTLVLPNGSSCYIFPVTKTSHPESKTLHLIIFEESQDLDDKIVKEQIWPMGASTNAPHVYIGTAGIRVCYFRKLGQGKEAIKLYFEDIVAQRREVYQETGDAQHLVYEQHVRQQIEKHGLEADEVQRPYFGKWLIGSGQFVTQEQLEAIEDRERKITYQYKKTPCYVGIDTAKHPDSTWVTVIRETDETVERKLADGTVEYGRRKEVINWLELRGDNYQHQFDVIKHFIGNYDVRAIAIDSTGQGDFMPDMFQAHTQWQDEGSGLYRVKFSSISKDMMYKNLKVSIQQLLTTLPNLDTKIGEKFKQQMLDLQQEYKGQLLSVHHPDTPNAHDDGPDSWALAEWAYAKYHVAGEPQLIVISDNTKERHVQKDEDGNVQDYWPGADDF